MKIVWVTRSFLDYRIPVYEELDRLCENNLSVIYYSDVVPERCKLKLRSKLGERDFGLTGEVRIGGKKIQNQAFSNSAGIRIPIRPGLIKLIRKIRPDILVTDGFFQWTYSALIINALWRTPHVMCYERTLHTERNVSCFKTKARKLAAKYINAICCNGIQTQEYLKTLDYPKDWIFSGNMAADTAGLRTALESLNSSEIIHFRNRFNIKGPVFLYSGQLIPRKGVMELLSTWQIFTSSASEPVLLLIGDGEQWEEASKFVLGNGLKNVILLGKVDYSEIHLYYSLADILVMPTLEDNWSLVVPEAMSCGLPVMCSKYNGCWPELVKPENGWVFDPLDEDDFIDTLKNAWSARDKWSRMGDQSLRIVQDFTPERVAATIYEACSMVLNK